ncbi:MAG: hypothetical protein H0T17_08915 [Propionibacteriales bacterium]|nr:hypothetical protein [Propionibacteriales bacterium]
MGVDVEGFADECFAMEGFAVDSSVMAVGFAERSDADGVCEGAADSAVADLCVTVYATERPATASPTTITNGARNLRIVAVAATEQ